MLVNIDAVHGDYYLSPVATGCSFKTSSDRPSRSDRITGITRVWVVTDRGSRWAIDDLEQLDFRVVRSSEIHRTTVHELIRSARP
jgi:hypothetical protein